MIKILIVDDEKHIGDSLQFALEDNYNVFVSQTIGLARETLIKEDISIVLLDLNLGNENGLDFLKEVKKNCPEIQVIVITAYGTIESSVKAIKEGAYHYLTKPLDMEELYIFIEKAIEYRDLHFSLENLKSLVNEKYNFKGIIGNSKKLKDTLQKVEKVMNIDSTVLITGESGTGKDLIAKALHFQGRRRDSSFVVVNCAAIPNNLLESELFGYEKGAFTGAIRSTVGKVKLANKGTLFLDEIAEMDLQLQAKILRMVEDMVVTPIGSNTPTKIDVRIIAATNKDLLEEVKKGNFREDLFYRLNVIKIEIPPLRERKEDIPLLIEHFLNEYNKKLNKDIKKFSETAQKVLYKYNYPGNIRELENLVEMVVALSDKDIIDKEDIPDHLYDDMNDPLGKNKMCMPIGTSLKEIERKAIMRTLEYYDGNRKRTAEKLEISIRNLQYKIKEYNI